MVRFASLGWVLLLLLLLAACRPFPLTADVDLLARTDLERDGSVDVTIEAGEVGSFDRREPDDDGDCVPLGGDEWRPTVHAARLHYDVTVRYEGPPLEGRLSGTGYVAPDRDALWEAPSRLAPEVSVDLAQGSKRLTGTVDLGPRQLEALRERTLCWGAVIRGEDVAALDSGAADVHYRVDRLVLTVRYGVL